MTKPTEDSITHWLDQVKQGDSLAAQQLWQQYFHRLVRLARKKLKDAPRRVADEEDVVLSAFDSFCRGAEQGRFPQLDDRDDLWQVLVMITARKATNQRKHDRRQKRGGGLVRGESVFVTGQSDPDWAGIDQVVGAEPTPEFASQVGEECQELLDRLNDSTLQNVALWKLEGCTNDEIAGRLECKIRTVERKLQLIRQLWSHVD
jgi:DNA-directed RNA polymerase specialized sigma24 family protein